MSVPLEQLPDEVRTACLRLRDELSGILSEDLIALWLYGAATFADPPNLVGDIDTHALLGRPPASTTVQRIDETHVLIARELGIEWDSWYILVDDATRRDRPRHFLRDDDVRDEAWALHRAHWLAGRYVLLHGRVPEDIVPRPSWSEIEEDLRLELAHIERHVRAGDDDPREARYAILNGCRILHSVETRNVVISKRDAAEWALKHLPDRWHGAIRSAKRLYDRESAPENADEMRAAMGPFVAFVRDRATSRT